MSNYYCKILILLFLFPFDSNMAQADEISLHAGSDSCIDCHTQEYTAWQESHHAWAWRPATEDTVLADFDETAFTHQGITTRFFRQDGGFWIETDGLNDARHSYEVKYTVGVTPLQQYLIETDGGRLQMRISRNLGSDFA